MISNGTYFVKARLCSKVLTFSENLNFQIMSKWGIPRTGYLVPGRDTPRARSNGESCSDSAAVMWFFLGGAAAPPEHPCKSAYRPPGFTGWFHYLLPGWLSSWLVWLLAARIAVQLTDLITCCRDGWFLELLVQWRVLRMGCFQYSQDPVLSDFLLVFPGSRVIRMDWFPVFPESRVIRMNGFLNFSSISRAPGQ